MSLLDNFPDICKIQRRIRQKSANGTGGTIDVPYIERSGISCWLQQASSSEINEYAKRGINIDHKVFFVENPNVTENHQIVVYNRSGVAVNVVMDVHSQPDPDASAGLGVVWRVMTNQVTSEKP